MRDSRHILGRLQILVDAHEQYLYRFDTQQVRTARRALPCGDYGLVVDRLLVASLERKSLADLVASLTSGKLRLSNRRFGRAAARGGGRGGPLLAVVQTRPRTPRRGC